MTISRFAYGSTEAMVAEYAAFNVLEINPKYRYCVLAIGDEQFETEPFTSRKAARRAARSYATELKVKWGSVD